MPETSEYTKEDRANLLEMKALLRRLEDHPDIAIMCFGEREVRQSWWVRERELEKNIEYLAGVAHEMRKGKLMVAVEGRRKWIQIAFGTGGGVINDYEAGSDALKEVLAAHTKAFDAAIPGEVVEYAQPEVINVRERGTILAALRLFAKIGNSDVFDPIFRTIATDGGEFTALSADEIDELCERLNV